MKNGEESLTLRNKKPSRSAGRFFAPCRSAAKWYEGGQVIALRGGCPRSLPIQNMLSSASAMSMRMM